MAAATSLFHVLNLLLRFLRAVQARRTRAVVVRQLRNETRVRNLEAVQTVEVARRSVPIDGDRLLDNDGFRRD